MKSFVLLFTFIIATCVSYSFASVTFLIGAPGVGKTTIINNLTDSDFPISSDIHTCTGFNGTDVMNRKGNFIDMEGIEGFQGRSIHELLVAFFDVMNTTQSIQNIVWVKSCSDGRLPKGLNTLLTHLKDMKVHFNFIVHDNKCNGNCATCELNENQLSNIHQVEKRIFTRHINLDPNQPDWEHVKQQYQQILSFPTHSVSLPPNYREILNHDNYKLLMSTFLENDCTTVTDDINTRVKKIDDELEAKQKEIDAKYSVTCASTKTKTSCHTEQRNVAKQCGRICRVEILGICIDWASRWCNFIEDFAVCNQIEDYEAREKENEECKQLKESTINDLTNSKISFQSNKEFLVKDQRYIKCMNVLGIK